MQNLMTCFRKHILDFMMQYMPMNQGIQSL